MKKYLTLILSCSVMALMACNNGSETARSGQVTATGVAAIGGAFTLIDHNGQTVTEADLLGRPTLTYFGFTYCPDVCPTALQSLGAALAPIDPKGDYFNTVLFSVDPERDTPELLKQYVKAPGFPKGLIGLTGDIEEVEAAKLSYKIYAAKVIDDSASDYLVDHASLIYLFDAGGKFVDVFTHGTSVADMRETLARYKKGNPL